MEYYFAIKKNSQGDVFTSFPCPSIPSHLPPPVSITWSKNPDFVTCFCEQPMLGLGPSALTTRPAPAVSKETSHVPREG